MSTHAATDGPLADRPPALASERGADGVTVRGGFDEVALSLSTPEVRIGDAEPLSLAVEAADGSVSETVAEILAEGPSLVRVRHSGTLGSTLAVTVTFDVFQSRDVGIYVRVEATAPTDLSGLRLALITPGGGQLAAATDVGEPGRRWVDLPDHGVGIVVKKLPWKASWNDIGCHDHWTLGQSVLAIDADRGAVELVAGDSVSLAVGDTVEAALMIVPRGADGERVRREGTHELPDEVRYAPEGEWMQTLVWESQDVWLGPPITEGAPQRPYDQLIPRPVGLNVLARKRFNWNNEDFGLHRLTGKHGYWETGVKKAHALLATQNEYGGWYEGIEFYNLPPRHHHMYDTYIGGMFLLEAYDATGDEAFLAGARRCQDFWLGDPPANGHTEVGDGGWWYRWGGYINEFGYTDERHVLNTHSGATAFLALLHERTGEESSREAAERGLKAVRWGLEQGIQRGDGQFLYCLSQVDPTLERPGDPPYLRLELVPQIEDVYTIAASYRLMMATRIVPDEVVTAAVRRALGFWWGSYRAGTAITYRAYATIAFAVAAGDIDPVYALALPELLKDREHYTSMQRGLSRFVVPAGLPLLKVSVDGFNGSLIEPVFVRQERDRLVFALVNLEHRQRGVGATVTLPEGVEVAGAKLIDPATREAVALDTVEPVAGGARVVVPEIREFGVVLVELELRP